MRLSVHKGQSDVVVCVCEEELEYAALRGEAIRRHSQGNHVILFFVVSPSVFVLRVEGEREEKRRALRALFAILRDFLLLSGEKSLLIVRNGEIES